MSVNVLQEEGLQKIAGNGITEIDSELSDMSTNPVQNKAVTNALSEKADKESVEQKIGEINNQLKKLPYTDSFISKTNAEITTSTQTGAACISFDASNEVFDSLIFFDVLVYTHASYPAIYHIGFSDINKETKQINKPTVFVSSHKSSNLKDLTVRFGHDFENAKIWIGDLDNLFFYGMIHIYNVHSRISMLNQDLIKTSIVNQFDTIDVEIEKPWTNSN